MMLPETVKIGAYTVTVRMVRNTMTDDGLCGSYCSRSKEINIDPDLTPEYMYGVFIHEIVEAITDIYHIECLAEDHHGITQLGEALHAVLRENMGCVLPV